LYNNEYFYCPFNTPQTPIPFYNELMRSLEDAPEANYHQEDPPKFEDNKEYFEGARAPQREVIRILRLLDNQKPYLRNDFRRYRVSPVLIDSYFRIVIAYTIDNASRFTGTINQRTNAIFNSFRRSNSWMFAELRANGVPVNVINETFREIIEFTLRNIDTQPGPGPVPGGWSRWENLGGVLTSAPAAASWAPNRLDTFVRGTDNALYHKWWDGSRWSGWERLGGSLTSAPGAVSWGPNRIDVFVRGTDNAMYHLFWNGSRWSEWENLGGVLTSAPAAASWAPNRIDTFVRGSDNALYHKWWDGSRWSEWENLGGSLTSAPAAVSWGPNRIDVFGRGTDNALYHIFWNGSRWSTWENLGGRLTSGPAVSSRAVNRLEVFSRGQNNQLMTINWNGSRWSGWQNIGGDLTSEPAAVSWGPNRTDVFVRGRDNAMYHTWRT
jgi:hypothetical protein